MTRQVGEVIRRGNIYHAYDILPIKFTDSIFINSVKSSCVRSDTNAVPISFNVSLYSHIKYRSKVVLHQRT